MNDFLDVRREEQVEQLTARLAHAQTDEELLDTIRELAEQSGAKPETVRLALRMIQEQSADRSLPGRLRRQVRQMDFATKRVVASAFLSLQFGLVHVLRGIYGDEYGLGVILQIAVAVAVLYNLTLARQRDLGMLAGATFGAGVMIGLSFFSWLLHSPHAVDGIAIIPAVLLGGALGSLVGAMGDKILQIRLSKDPEKRRAELLKQLVELQEELKAGERMITFLSVDVVGSTRIKQGTDHLSAEYSFNEYVKYVTAAAMEFGGAVHSTAGDGLLLAFEHPHEAFQAARRIHAGMIEFNSYRNRTKEQFQLRCGIHTGPVVTPGNDLSSLNHSEVIDVTAHVQKVAQPGGIAVSEDAAVFIPGGGAAIGAENGEVHGVRTYLWQSSTSAAPASVPAALPPLPSPTQ